ncbi:general stress protein [Brevibacillus sp. TJ4]|uniref:general stress protein n=1 Tax=Brevibacillus sp. TJ4 TaxID=3234853 RepID=UPI003B9E55FD
MIGTTSPFVKFHHYDQELVSDIEALNSSGYHKDDIWVLKLDTDRNESNQRSFFYKFRTHPDGAVGDLDSKANFIANGAEELRKRLAKLGFAKDERDMLVSRLEDTDYTCILVVRDLRDDIIGMQDVPPVQ